MEISTVSIVIDGPNFINRILELKIDQDIIAEQLTLDGFRSRLNAILEEKFIPVRTDQVEFVCSRKLFGQGASKFTQNERDSMLQRLMGERGIHIEEVNLPGSSEKGVDTTVASTIETYIEKHESIFLVSHDRDYVPVLRKMRLKGKKIYLIALNDEFPCELINESYETMQFKEEFRHFFTYSYQNFFIGKSLDVKNFRKLISNADDRQNNKLIVNKDGMVYFSRTGIFRKEFHDDAKFSLETFHSFNDYVGPRAASSTEYIEREYNHIVSAWEQGE